jgi:hypothetical protein
MDADKRRAAEDAVMVPFHNARIAALHDLIRRRTTELANTCKLAMDGRTVPGLVWLCDEHGVLPTLDPQHGPTLAVPMRVALAGALAIGAEIREDGMAHLKLGVAAPR